MGSRLEATGEGGGAVVTLLLVGAGNRGTIYSTYALERPDLCKVIGVAEPKEFQRNRIVQNHQVVAENIFTDWKQAAARPRFADAVLICTQDQMHMGPAVAFADKGYHILLEKPMAIKEEDCKRVVDAVLRNNVIFSVGHVLRYTPHTQKIKSLVASGVIGDIVSVQHLEPVGFYHAAHSYVRGNWRRTEDSSFMLMTKSCHDIDWIRYIINSRCTKVSSFGTLKHFRPENKPAGAASRCLNCPPEVERACPYSAKKIYLDSMTSSSMSSSTTHYKEKFNKHIVDAVPDIENVTNALLNGPYGRCVYECDNDVVDNQVLNMVFENGCTASFSMVSFTKEICERKTRIWGTKGELEATNEKQVRVFDFVTGEETIYNTHGKPADVETRLDGHGYADFYLMQAFIDAVIKRDPSRVLAGPQETLESHLIVFAAEQSRLDGTVVSINI